MRDFESSKRPKLAIISTVDELCGIAGYTRALTSYLDDVFEIETFDLDQFLMRGTSQHVIKLADRWVEDMCTRLSEFDAVNLQLEFGTLGYAEKDILRRFRMIVAAAPHLSVTFHTILRSEGFPTEQVRKKLTRAKLWQGYAITRDHRVAKRFRKDIYAALREAQMTKPVHVIVHTKRDARAMSYVEQFKNVHHHPLAFLPPQEAAAVRASASLADYPGLKDLPPEARVVGVFGFMSEYKGIHTALKALRLLPDNYHLAIFGGLHPGEIRPPERGKPAEVHPYVGRILAETYVDETLPQALGEAQLSVEMRGGTGPETVYSPRSMQDRVHFMGVQSDDALTAAMAAVDVVVLPYFEVGQASSGPMSIATELGARIVASRNQAFMQFAKYHPDRATFFDVGNHLELAQRITQAFDQPRNETPLTWSTESNKDIYIAAHTRVPAR